ADVEGLFDLLNRAGQVDQQIAGGDSVICGQTRNRDAVDSIHGGSACAKGSDGYDETRSKGVRIREADVEASFENVLAASRTHVIAEHVKRAHLASRAA